MPARRSPDPPRGSGDPDAPTDRHSYVRWSRGGSLPHRRRVVLVPQDPGGVNAPPPPFSALQCARGREGLATSLGLGRIGSDGRQGYGGIRRRSSRSGRGTHGRRGAARRTRTWPEVDAIPGGGRAVRAFVLRIGATGETETHARGGRAGRRGWSRDRPRVPLPPGVGREPAGRVGTAGCLLLHGGHS